MDPDSKTQNEADRGEMTSRGEKLLFVDHKFSRILGWAGVAGAYAIFSLPILLRYPPIWPDEVLFASPAESLARGERMGTPVLAGFLPGMDRYTYWLPPGYFVTLALFFRFFRSANPVIVMRVISWTLGLVLLVATGVILRQLRVRFWMIWSTLLLLATHGTIIRAANLGRMDMLTLLASSGSVVFYLQYLEKSSLRWLAGAGFLGGLACLYHPAGAVAPVALVLHQFIKDGARTVLRRDPYILVASILISLIPWITYILRAPDIFFVQFGAQLSRKADATGATLVQGTALGWFAHPLQLSKWEPLPLLPLSSLISALEFFAALLLLILPGRGKRAATVAGLWLILSFALNLFAPEDWYQVYFVVPLVVLLGWGVAASEYPWARSLGALAIFLGVVWNLTQAALLQKAPYGRWKNYERYTLALSDRIPPGSKVLLKAIPDPYFGLKSKGKALRFSEFIPEGLPVDRGYAEKELATVDYAIDSGCCNPPYLTDYLRAHGKIIGGVMSPIRDAPPVLIWKLHRSQPKP